MRGLISVIAVATIMPSTLSARSEEIPTLNVTPVCRGIAIQSADPGVGQGAQAETFRQCIESEQGVREELKRAWPSFSAADKRHCVVLAKTGGESSNTELLTCLEMARDVRVLRSAAAGGSADTPKAAPAPPASTGQPAPGGAASQSPPPKEPPKTTTATPTVAEVERAKTEAETAKASETLAQRKLADAEAALQQAKEEIKRANGEADRARAAEQAAKESEAAVKRKLTDAEGARAAAERACTPATRPGLAGRLRGWLKRPSTKSP
jgi:hypothetical protein